MPSPIRTSSLATAVMLVLAGCSSGPEGSPRGTVPLFRELAEESGLRFRHFGGGTGQYFLPEIMGAGVALLDFDLDGDLDVYLLQSDALSEHGKPGNPRVSPNGKLGNRLFENRIRPDGALTFSDATASSGLGFRDVAMGVAVGDYDGDLYPDIYLTNFGPNRLLRNRGDGSFLEIEGPQDTRWSTSATFFDYDSDSDLDLFFANFVDFSSPNNKQCFSETGERDYCIPTVYRPVPDRLFRNEGGRYVDATKAAGLDAAFGNGLGVIAADLDGDGMTDLYVANDTTENQMWINRGDGRFEDRAMARGSAVNGDGRVEAGMGVVAADLDRDGDQDLFMTHNARETNTLYLNDGSGGFTDATNRFGLGNPSFPHTGFGVVSADFDADGLLDIFVANGAVAIMEALRGDPFPFRQPNQIYRGQRNGFGQIGELEAWGSLEPLASRGVSQGDIDLDGDIDLVVANNNGPVRLYLNLSDAHRSLKVKLDGLAGNRYGIGAQVRLCADDGTCVTRRLHRDGSYLSSSEAAVYFTQSVNANPRRLEVRWPSGRSEGFPVPAGRTEVRLQEGSGEPFGHASPARPADL